MSVWEGHCSEQDEDQRPPDPAQGDARIAVERLINDYPGKVFFSRQIEVILESRFFHWVTNRAIRELAATNSVLSESRKLRSGGTIKLLWHKSNRYYLRAARKVVGLVEEYANPNIGSALGLHGEFLWCLRRVRAELDLPVDAPRALEEGTMRRFTNWHRENL